MHGLCERNCVHGLDHPFCSPVGVALYLEGSGVVQNNSIIRLAVTNTVRELECISAAESAGVGQFIAPNGNDITGNSSIVSVGDSTDPGFVSLQLASFIRDNPGVYTCIIPDGTGIWQHLHVGIYHSTFNGKIPLKLVYLIIVNYMYFII